LEGHKKPALKPSLGLFSTMALVVGSVLGAGAFMKPPAVLLAAGDSNWAMAAWLVSAFFSMAGGLTLCELGAMFPRAGGVYIFLEEIYGPKMAYLYGWMITILYGPAVVGAMTGYFSSIFCLLFNIPANYIPLVGFSVLLFVLFVNSIGVKEAGYLQMIATLCKLVPVVLLTIFGLWKGNGQVFNMPIGDSHPAGVFSLAVIATLFAYDGWANVSAMAGEIKDPARTLPRAIISGLLFLSAVYILINIAFIKIIPPEQLVSLGHDAAAIVAQKLFGLYGGNIVSVGIMISVLGGLNGYAMTVSRMIYAMGEQGQLPGSRYIGKIDSDSNTPVNAFLLLVVMAFVYFQLLNPDLLTDIAMFSIWIFFAMTFIGVIIARKKFATLPRIFKVPLYPYTPIVAIAGALYIIVGMLMNEPVNSLISILLTLSGIPVFLLFIRKRKSVFKLRLRKKYVLLICGLMIIGLFSAGNKVFDNRPVLTVAVETSNPPIAFENSAGLPDGLDIELIKAIAERNGYRVKFRPTSFEHLLDAVEQKLADVAIGEITITEARQQRVDFTDSYYRSGLALAVHTEGKINTVAELDGHILGVKSRTTGVDYSATLHGKIRIEKIDTTSNLINLFNDNKIDAILYDRPILEQLVDKNTLKSARLISVTDNERYGFAYSKNDKALGVKLNNGLRELKDGGKLRELLQKWL
jgi:APA family basic amino acid/polyamine antiporter